MKDTIILKFEVDSDLNDTKKSMEITKEVSDYMQKFPKGKLINFSVEYVWNREQRVKQTEEFLKKNPEWLDREKKYLDSLKNPKWEKTKELVKEKLSKDNLSEKEFKEWIDNPNKVV